MLALLINMNRNSLLTLLVHDLTEILAYKKAILIHINSNFQSFVNYDVIDEGIPPHRVQYFITKLVV